MRVLGILLAAATAGSLLIASDAGAAKRGRRPSSKSFWLASEPHVPLAEVAGGRIRTVPGKRGVTCGAASRWAKVGSRWNAVGRFGELLGLAEVTNACLYDVTGCSELALKTLSGKSGSGVFVSADSAYKPAPSVAFDAGASARGSFEALVRRVEGDWVTRRIEGKSAPIRERSLTFRTPGNDADGRKPHVFAVAGGPLLVVAALEVDTWKLSHVERYLGFADAYKVLGVFDMNGDGRPEIVVHWNEGTAFADAVFELDDDRIWGSPSWRRSAESPGGATL